MVTSKTNTPLKSLSRAQRRLAEKHASKHTPAVEPMPIQIPKTAIIAGGSILLLLCFFGIKTSLEASGDGKPFNVDQFQKSKTSRGGAKQDSDYEPNPRDTSEEYAPNGDWLLDPTMAESMSLERCDLERVPYANMTTTRFLREFQSIKPVIVEGVVDEKWPAKTAGRWARSSLMSAFGDSPIHVSSGSGIVHSGGESLRTVTLSDFVEEIRETKARGPSATSFTFDMEFVEGNPELKEDFKVPTIFRSFNSHESMRRGGSWNIFSLGASGAGLPFHMHGETWLGLVYGAKRWGLYPPNTPRPYGAEKLAGWHPLMGALEWFKDVMGFIQKTGEAPPIECIQQPGDLIYVPSNWQHMTLNIGETVGVGGQARYDAETRLRDALKLLETMPNDPEVLHSLGVGLAHRGIDALMQEGTPEEAPALEWSKLDFDLFLNSLANGARLTAAETLELASVSLKKSIADYPLQPESYIILAETLAMAGKQEEAEEFIEKAWKLFSQDELPEGVPDSTLVVVQLNLARFFLQVDDGLKAEAYLKAGPLKLEPNHGDAVADLAVALAMQGGDKLPAAADTLNRAEELGAAGAGFQRRRAFVTRLTMQAAQRERAAATAAEIPEEEGGAQDSQPGDASVGEVTAQAEEL